MSRDGVPDVGVEGRARRRVVPDRVRVTVSLRTPVVRTPQAALRDAVAARERLRARAESALPDAERADGRLVAEPQQARETRPLPAGADHPGGLTQTEWVTVGYAGVGEMRLDDAAEKAAAMVDALRGHADAEGVVARFYVAPATRDAVHDTLQCDALRDARDRAANLAAALGQAIGPALSVDALAGQPRPWGGVAERLAVMDAADGGDAGTDDDPEMSELVPEPVEVVATVHARFALRAPEG